MKLSEYAKTILLNSHIEDKLFNVDSIEFDDFDLLQVPKAPGRSERIKLSSKTVKFPKGNLHENDKKAKALNSFANHELLAVEMMACALLIYPHHTEELKRFKRGVISSLQDEQKHFSLYRARMNELGYEFGDFAINEFFWKQMENLKTPSQYHATMSLTFEAANLDFASYYKDIFTKMGDHKTADILNTVLVEEISHVGIGVHYMNLWRKDKKLWDYYQESLPFPMTPARSKGQVFQADLRAKAKMPTDFITNTEKYQDNFKITQRKEWKR